MDSKLDIIPEEALLINLKKYLNYQIPTFALFAFSFFSIICLIITAAAAVIFIPYITYVLNRYKKYNWMLILFIVIIFPSVLLIAFLQETLTLFLFLLIELAAFYFYCFTLRMVVNDWVREITMAKLIDYQRQRRAQQEEDERLNNRGLNGR